MIAGEVGCPGQLHDDVHCGDDDDGHYDDEQLLAPASQGSLCPLSTKIFSILENSNIFQLKILFASKKLKYFHISTTKIFL